jgi:hypothetical protein
MDVDSIGVNGLREDKGLMIGLPSAVHPSAGASSVTHFLRALREDLSQFRVSTQHLLVCLLGVTPEWRRSTYRTAW